jgi:hypothetical protein
MIRRIGNLAENCGRKVKVLAGGSGHMSKPSIHEAEAGGS